jgi:hypothetical protein
MSDTSTERADPRPRPINPAQSGQVKHGTENKDRAYRLSNPLDEVQGLQYDLDTGWNKIDGRNGKDRERLVGGRIDEKNGTVSFRGQVLLWMSKEDWDAQNEMRRQALVGNEQRRNSGVGLDGLTDALGKPALNSTTGPNAA